jgi:hypothetical protein
VPLSVCPGVIDAQVVVMSPTALVTVAAIVVAATAPLVELVYVPARMGVVWSTPV